MDSHTGNAPLNVTTSNTESSGHQSSAASSANQHGKKDPAWEHFAFRKDGGTNVYTCLHCSSVYRGGGINRMKQHLAGVPGQISSCKKVDHDVRKKMLESLNKIQKKNVNEDLDEAFNDQSIAMDEVQELNPCPRKKQTVDKDKGKRKSNADIDTYFAPRTTSGSQPSLQSVLATKEAMHKAKMALARWFYDACIPFYAIQSPFFQPALDAVAAIGPGFKGPSYHELRLNLLGDCKRECQLLVDSYRANWAKTGCTIMTDGWTDQRSRTLINFLVYCEAGITFVKSVDASDIVKDAITLANMISEVIEWVGPKNVVHVVTDNAANYASAGTEIHNRYPHIFWSPCAAHCLNLLLKDIVALPHVAELVSKAAKVTSFMYNHMIFLSWLRKREGWREIVRPGVTRFATTFITLKSVLDHKHDLQALVVDKHFTTHRLSRTPVGRAVNAIVLDNRFWNDFLVMVTIVAPMIRLLRIVDADEKPSLGYVYDGMLRAKNTVMKKIFKDKPHLYQPYTDIIKKRWDRHLKRHLHAAAYLLNPQFVYNEDFDKKNRVTQSLVTLLNLDFYCDDLSKGLQELQLYRDRKGSFGHEKAVQVAKTLRPDHWWIYFGGSAPTLQKLAIRLLSQTSSSSGCERNWSIFECIHTKRRNKLEHQRLSDLVYITYNLRLKNRVEYKKRSYDPIDYECIEKVDFWVVEDEPPREFDDDEFDDLIYEENAAPIVGESSRASEGNEVIMDLSNQLTTLGSFGDLDIYGVGADDAPDIDGVHLQDYYD